MDFMFLLVYFLGPAQMSLLVQAAQESERLKEKPKWQWGS